MSEWMTNAACKGMDTALFFPAPGESHLEAQQTCAACPVQAECLAEAQSRPDTQGIWGGISQRQRGRVRVRLTEPKSCGTPAGYTRHLRAGEDACQRCLDAKAHAQSPSGESVGRARGKDWEVARVERLRFVRTVLGA